MRPRLAEARHSRAVQAAHRSIELRERLAAGGIAAYVLVTFFAVGVFWGLVLPVPLEGWVGDVLWLGTWTGLLWLRVVALRRWRSRGGGSPVR